METTLTSRQVDLLLEGVVLRQAQELKDFIPRKAVEQDLQSLAELLDRAESVVIRPR